MSDYPEFTLVVQMATAWNAKMAEAWVILRASKIAPGLVNPETVDDAMMRGLQAEKFRDFWYGQ